LKDTPYEEKEAEWDNYKKFRDQNPKPYQLVRHCSEDYTEYILAVPGTVTTAHRGYPREIKSFTVLGRNYEAFVAFLQTHEIARDVNPKWLLASYWG